MHSEDRPDVLLIAAPSTMESRFKSTTSLYKPTEPLGLLYIAANLLKHGYSVRFIDFNAEGIALPEAISLIEKIQPKILGISCLTQEAYMVEELLKQVRHTLPQTPVVMGNVHSSYFFDYYLKNNLSDYVVHGDGEETMVALTEVILSKGDPKTVNGISYLDSEGGSVTTPPNIINDLDALPPPAWELAKIEKYKASFYYNFQPDRTRIMISSRGCPIGCTFCTIHDGKKVRFHSAERVVAEIQHLVDTYGTTHINFQDPMFLTRPSRVRDICNGLIDKGIKIGWACEAHVNYAREDLFEIMKKAGCHTVFFGLECGDDALLKNIGKRTTVEQGKKAIHMARKYGLKPVGFFLLGVPGETEALSQKTIDFGLSLPLDMAFFSITVPLPGSQMFKEFVENDKRFDPYNWNGFSNTGYFGDKNPEWSPPGLPYEKLKVIQANGMRRFHLRPKMILRHLWTLRRATLHDFKAVLMTTWMTLKESFASRPTSS
ncbi:MAG: radical SAM protein [Magnetococcales bacterium]|nr:radical SAM protein [Magnetococcales bacterium]